MFPIPDPLHPAVVHFPIVFAMLLPLVALVTAWAIRRGTVARQSWLLVVALGAALLVSGWVAEQTGSREEEQVESVVSESAIHEHEEGAERFVLLAGATLIVLVVGMAPGALGGAARGLGLAAALGLVAVGWQVGHSGGSLVYRDGAASAYAQPSGASAVGGGEEGNGERGRGGGGDEEGEGDDDDD